MACSLSITSVTGLSAGGITTAIRVTGTLGGDCTPIVFSPTIKFDVVVEVDCGMGPSSATTLSSGGNWSVDVPITCSCNKPVRVEAHCASNPDCADNVSGALQCEEQGLCPAGSISVSVDGCNPDGTRNVTLVANITSVPPGTVVGQFDYGDGGFSQAIVVPGPGAFPDPGAPHHYVPPGPANPVRFIWVLPANCPPLTAVVSGLQTCPINCPQIVSVTASPPGQCNPAGTRTVHLDATLSGGPAQFYHWEYGDGTDDTIPAAMSPAVDHDYPAPSDTTYTAIFTVTGFNGACVDSASVTIDIERCGSTPPPPPPPTDEGGGCMGLRAAGVIAAILAALALYICQCVPLAGAGFCWASLGFAILSAILLGIWFFWCPKPCGAALLIAWQIALGSGIGALYFAPCCPFLWVIGAALIAAAIAGLIVWRRRCRRTRCQVLAELGIVITVVVVPVLGWLAGVPFLSACLNPIVGSAVGLLSAAIAWGLIRCATQADPAEEASQ